MLKEKYIQLSSISELKRLKGAYLYQHSLYRDFFQTLGIFEVKTFSQGLKMLERGRIDYLVAPGWDSVRESGGSLRFNPKLVVGYLSDTLACHNNAFGRKVIESFNQELVLMDGF